MATVAVVPPPPIISPLALLPRALVSPEVAAGKVTDAGACVGAFSDTDDDNDDDDDDDDDDEEEEGVSAEAETGAAAVFAPVAGGA